MKHSIISAKIISASALCIVSALGTEAQNLSKEVVARQEFHPELQAATRLNNFPSTLSPDIKPSRLSFSDMTAATSITGMLNPLEPASAGNALAISDYRGYASLGYFPAFNLGASAGYRIIEKPRTSLGVWMQYNGLSYDFKPIVGSNSADKNLERNAVTFGADFIQLFRRAGRLDVSADFSYYTHNLPIADTDLNPDFSSRAFNLDVTWSARKHDVIYYLDAKWNHFTFAKRELLLPVSEKLAKSLNQNIFTFKGGASYHLGDGQSVVGLASFDLVRYNHYNRLTDEFNPDLNLPYHPWIASAKGKSLGLISLNPSYRYQSQDFKLNIGLLAQISTNSGKTFHIAPDVSADYAPKSWLGINARIGGGEHINRLHHLYLADPYMSPSVAYDFSHRPITFDASVKIGPFTGFSLELFAGYAVANDWLMPLAFNDPALANPAAEAAYHYLPTFNAVNLSAWHYGASLAFRWNHYLEGSIKYTGAPGSYHHSYFLNYDRATSVFNVELTSRPLDKLTINAGFQLRSGRTLYQALDSEAPLNEINLDNSNNLTIGARYAFFPWLSVHARVENILNNKADDIWMAQSQGVHGLVGLSVKF